MTEPNSPSEEERKMPGNIEIPSFSQSYGTRDKIEQDYVVESTNPDIICYEIKYEKTINISDVGQTLGQTFQKLEESLKVRAEYVRVKPKNEPKYFLSVHIETIEGKTTVERKETDMPQELSDILDQLPDHIQKVRNTREV